MAERWNRKRLTRADALVVGATCLLLILLVPALLGKPREQSVRELCEANLAQIGKIMLLYANDHGDALPRTGGPTTLWGPVPNWAALPRYPAFGLNANNQGGTATVSSCLYLLVKYYEAPTRLFLCRGDQGTTEFKLSDFLGRSVPTNCTLANLWDFGPRTESFRHCSYSYHIPFSGYPLTTKRDPNLAVAADRNPWLMSPMAGPAIPAFFRPDLSGFGGTPAQACAGNAIAHDKDGQNVLFLDGRVSFEKRAYCGIDSDNIYLISFSPDRGSPVGTVPAPPAAPSNEHDSVLVHDPNTWSSGSKTQ